MNTFKKNQIIITALAIMIAIVGYLHFTEKGNADEEQYVFNNEPDNTLVTMSEVGGSLVPNEDGLLNTNVIIEDETTEVISQDVEDVDHILEDITAETDKQTVAKIDGVTQEASAEVTKEVGEAVLVSSNSVNNSYFLESKIKREQTRASSLEILLDVINNESIGEEQKVQAATEMINLQDRIEKEAAAESVLEAKGFDNVFVRIDESSVDVVVNAKELTDVELAQITEVVARKTGFDPTQIVITPLKIQE